MLRSRVSLPLVLTALVQVILIWTHGSSFGNVLTLQGIWCWRLASVEKGSERSRRDRLLSQNSEPEGVHDVAVTTSGSDPATVDDGATVNMMSISGQVVEAHKADALQAGEAEHDDAATQACVGFPQAQLNNKKRLCECKDSCIYCAKKCPAPKNKRWKKKKCKENCNKCNSDDCGGSDYLAPGGSLPSNFRKKVEKEACECLGDAGNDVTEQRRCPLCKIQELPCSINDSGDEDTAGANTSTNSTDNKPNIMIGPDPRFHDPIGNSKGKGKGKGKSR